MGRPENRKPAAAVPKGTSSGKRAAISKNKAEKSATNDLKECFTTEVQENGDVWHILNTSLTLKQRQELSCLIPDLFRQHHRPGTESDELPERWMMCKDCQRHFIKTDDGLFFTCAWLSPETIIKLGLLPKMVRKQEIALTPGFKEKLKSYLSAEDRENDPSHFEMGFSSSQGNGDFCESISPIARGGPFGKKSCVQDPDVIEFLDLSTDIANTSLDYIIPEKEKELLKKHNVIDASMNRGPINRPRFVSAIQLNHSPLADKVLASLDKFGLLHVDGTDDKRSYTALDILSHLPEDTYPGNMLLPGLKLAALCAPFSIFVFQGNFAHVSRGLGTYTVPKDSPLRYKAPPGIPRPLHDRYARITTPCYPKDTLTRPAYVPKNELLTSTAIKVHWKTLETLQTWKMCFYIMRMWKLKNPEPKKESGKDGKKPGKGGKKHPKVYETVDGEKVEVKLLLPESYEDLDPEEVVKLFSWTDEETGETRYPSVETARICIAGQQETDDEWEAAKKVTDACCTGCAAKPKVVAQRTKKRKEYKDNVRLYKVLNDRMITKYKKYEDLGLVKPIPENQRGRSTGNSSVYRGLLTDQYSSLSRENQKLANKAVALGHELNRIEYLEREERFLVPKRTHPDNAVWILPEKFTGLSISSSDKEDS